MKRQRVSDAGLLSAGSNLCRICGTNIDTEGVEFTNQQPNLTYIDKVFSFQEDTSSPILFSLNTGGPFSDYYLSELTLDGCSIFPCTLSPNAVFKVDNSFVVVDFFSTNPPGSINASQVTLDGFPVDSVSFDNGQYTARTQNVLARVQNKKCKDLGLPTKAFFMINNAGPFALRATYFLEGTVNTGGRTCRFCARFSNAPDAPNTFLPNDGRSNFAVRCLSLPCVVNGISPDILFQFSAKVNLINPELFVDCSVPFVPVMGTAAGQTASKLTGIDLPIPDIPCPPIPHPPKPDPCPICPECPPCPPAPPCPPCPPVFVSPITSDACRVFLTATVSVEPKVHVETVRRTLLCINGCEGLQPCQGSVLSAAIEDIEECASTGGPDCRCSGVAGTSCDTVGGIGTVCNNVAGVSSCGIGGVAGIRDRHDSIAGIRDRCDSIAGIRDRCDSVAGIRDKRDSVAGIRDIGRCALESIAGVSGVGSCGLGSVGGISGCGGTGVLGTSGRAHLEKLLLEILDELAEESCDVAGIGLGADETFDCGNNVLGVSERTKNVTRTASRLRGSNGCSW